MSVRSIEAEVSIKSGVQAECTIGREVVVEVHDDVNLEALSVTANGSYRPASGIDGWDRVTVAVPPTIPDIESLTVIENGTYTAEGDGYNPVTVNVPSIVPIGPQFTLIGQSTHTLTEYTNTSMSETIDTGIDVTSDNHAFLLVVITCDNGTPAVENAWGGIYMDIDTRYISTHRVLTSTAGVCEYGTKSLLMSEASGLGTSNNNGPIHIVSNVPTVKFIRRASNNGRTVMAGTYTVKVYGFNSL